MPLNALETIPTFRIFDLTKAKEFYVDYLGFHVDWEHRFEPGMPVYMQVRLSGLVLHLSEHHGDCCPGSMAFVRVTGLEDYHAELTPKNYGYLRPGIEKTFYNTLCMTVTDPFGNRIRFDQNLNPEAHEKG